MNETINLQNALGVSFGWVGMDTGPHLAPSLLLWDMWPPDNPTKEENQGQFSKTVLSL